LEIPPRLGNLWNTLLPRRPRPGTLAEQMLNKCRKIMDTWKIGEKRIIELSSWTEFSIFLVAFIKMKHF
jgi:hypothetical protein